MLIPSRLLCPAFVLSWFMFVYLLLYISVLTLVVHATHPSGAWILLYISVIWDIAGDFLHFMPCSASPLRLLGPFPHRKILSRRSQVASELWDKPGSILCSCWVHPSNLVKGIATAVGRRKAVNSGEAMTSKKTVWPLWLSSAVLGPCSVEMACMSQIIYCWRLRFQV